MLETTMITNAVNITAGILNNFHIDEFEVPTLHSVIELVIEE